MSQPAPISKRLSALATDLFIVGVAGLTFGGFAAYLTGSGISVPVAVMIVGGACYFIGGDAKFGGTFGKRADELAVTRADGRAITFADAVVRHMPLLFAGLCVIWSATLNTLETRILLALPAAFIVVVFYVVDLIIVLADPDHRGLRDRLAGTMVVSK